MEDAAVLVVVLQVGGFFFDGGALRSSDGDLPPQPRSQFPGAAVRGLPFVGCRRTADPASTTSVQEAGGVSARSMKSDGVGPQRPAIGDFPSARGCSWSKVMESSSGGAPPTAPRTESSSRYPNDNEKLRLAVSTGLSRRQISNWFINARVRLWKPMVEEMYNDEFSEDSAVSRDDGASSS